MLRHRNRMAATPASRGSVASIVDDVVSSLQDEVSTGTLDAADLQDAALEATVEAASGLSTRTLLTALEAADIDTTELARRQPGTPIEDALMYAVQELLYAEVLNRLEQGVEEEVSFHEKVLGHTLARRR